MEIQKIHNNDITMQFNRSKYRSNEFNVSGHAKNLDHIMQVSVTNLE